MDKGGHFAIYVFALIAGSFFGFGGLLAMSRETRLRGCCVLGVGMLYGIIAAVLVFTVV